MYAYCSNNPVMMHDPSGMSGEGERIEYSKNPEGKIEGKIDTVVITPNKTELTTDNVNTNNGQKLDPSMFLNAGGFGKMALQDENTSSAASIPMNYQKKLIAEQAIYSREQEKITQCIQENQAVLFADGSGGTVGEIKKAQIAYNEQVGENVKGGFAGSATFIAGNFYGGFEEGAKWSFGGAILDHGATAMTIQRPNFSTQTSANVPKFEQTTSVLTKQNNYSNVSVPINEKRVSLYRNTGMGEYNSISKLGGKFEISPNHYNGKQFWIGTEGLSLMKESGYSKPITISLTLPESFANPNHINFIFMEKDLRIDTKRGGTILPDKINKFNSNMRINWIEY